MSLGRLRRNPRKGIGIIPIKQMIKEVTKMKLYELLIPASSNTITLVKDNKSKKAIAYGKTSEIMKSLSRDDNKLFMKEVVEYYTDFRMNTTILVVLVE